MSDFVFDEDEKDNWREFLERRFIAASHTEDEYLRAARRAHKQAIEWIRSKSRIKGSFLWVCETIGMEPSAIHRALKTKARVKSLEDLL